MQASLNTVQGGFFLILLGMLLFSCNDGDQAGASTPGDVDILEEADLDGVENPDGNEGGDADELSESQTDSDWNKDNETDDTREGDVDPFSEDEQDTDFTSDPDLDPEPDHEEDALSSPDGDALDSDNPPLTIGPNGEIDDLKLYVNLGDSVAAGYNATGQNGFGGRGFSRLLLDNHPNYPEYDGHHLSVLFPGLMYTDMGDSGATSSDTLEDLEKALFWSWPWQLPREVNGDVLVTINVGGNNFNDDISTMAWTPNTEAAAAALKADLRQIVSQLRARYEKPNEGKRVLFLIANVHDPTGGSAWVPFEFDDDFCRTIRAALLLSAIVFSNLDLFNQRIAEVVEEIGGYLVDSHSVFLGHGMDSGDERWIDSDCVHPVSQGHHQLRREWWYVLTGERY